MDLTNEIARRRTFGVIGHPDAGKTTLTEKLLLFGGGIRTAGAVKSNKIKKSAASDFMEIEKQRGISVSTAVLSFEYEGHRINILDTPGHKDFAEDTYRTLTAVDSVILVVDSAKGVEEQTEKLMHVCRMRKTPVIIFVNKLDRDGLPPFDLLDELESKLEIAVRPLTWPINRGQHFKGVYNLFEQNLYLFTSGKTVIESDRVLIPNLDDPELDARIGSDATQLREDVAMVEGVYDAFSEERYGAGEQAPVFFGSALNNFGVRELLETFLRIAPPPRPRAADLRTVTPEEDSFTGFVFKIHANLDPRHRDRIAFMRICSGTFRRSGSFHHVRNGKAIRFANLFSYMAEKKEVIDEAYPGDVVGLYDRGDLKIGDTITDGETLNFQGIPNFSPALFREAINADPMRSKQFHKGLAQLSEEGVAQLFTQRRGNRLILGTVGELQFDVIAYRLEHEYGAACRFHPLPYTRARWITSEDRKKLDAFLDSRERDIVFDLDEKPVYLAESPWILHSTMEKHAGIAFHETSEFKRAQRENGAA